MEKILCDEYYVAQTERGDYMICLGEDAWYTTSLESATPLDNDEFDDFIQNTSEENPYMDFHGQRCRLVKVRHIIESEVVYKGEPQ